MTETTVPMNRLCEFADIKDQRPSHKKQNLQRMLLYIKDNGQFSFNWEYLSRPAYMVRLLFTPFVSPRILSSRANFYLILLHIFILAMLIAPMVFNSQWHVLTTNEIEGKHGCKMFSEVWKVVGVEFTLEILFHIVRTVSTKRTIV